VFLAEVHDMRAGRPWWAMAAGVVGWAAVVVASVVGKYDTEVSLADDQHVVGEFGAEGADELFGDAVRPRAPRGNPGHGNALSARTASNDAVNPAVRSWRRNRNWVR
jgi:hypothetical protein